MSIPYPNDIASALGPERLLQLVQRLAGPIRPGEQATVEMNDLLDALLGQTEQLNAQQAWSARVALKQRLITQLAEIPTLRYVPGDA